MAHLLKLTRRKFIQDCSAAAIGAGTATAAWGRKSLVISQSGHPALQTLRLNDGWQFERASPGNPAGQSFGQPAASKINLPHCVTPLSWRRWDPAAWQDEWTYRRSFDLPVDMRDQRIFLHFDRVMAGATVTLNGHSFPQHLGGFLPFEYEITGHMQTEKNTLSVAVDARWLNAPPSGSPKGPPSVDYLLPGGIPGSVSLRALPQVFVADVFAKPVNVLDAQRRIEVTATIDAAGLLPMRIRAEATLRSGDRILSRSTQALTLEKSTQEIRLTLGELGAVSLWDPDHPQLYDIDVALIHNDAPVHRSTTRIGLREARFEKDGFFLNGRRLRLFGLNRHELYPYVGFAAPDRLLRRDAEILRRTFNCNAVRCSHYPQSEAFLNACDELGLMVWEEPPGWQYIGDSAWQELAVRDVEAMIRRDRNHPSIIIWGVRINESHNDPDLYRRTRALAHSLDGSRSTSGTMTRRSTEGWNQDVFAYDDYNAAPDHTVSIAPPLPDVPYMVSETVGQFNYSAGKGFDQKYRRAGDPVQQSLQAIWHAQAHDRAAGHPRCAGTIAWCAFDYGSLVNAYEAVKCPGIADVFRIPKPGAALYLAQVDPAMRTVVEPAFYWDFGPHTPNGPGERAAIFSNCGRLELFVDGKPHATLQPDRAAFPNLHYPPFFANLAMSGKSNPELRIDGYVRDKKALSRSFSSDHASDRFFARADDRELKSDGADATRLVFGVADKFGAARAFAGGEVTVSINGPGTILGDNPFNLADTGGTGAVWIRSVSGQPGRITVNLAHAALGKTAVEIVASPPQ